MSNEDSYTAHRRALRAERGLPPIDDSDEVGFADINTAAFKGFVTPDGQLYGVFTSGSEQEAGLPDGEWAPWVGPEGDEPGRKP